MSGGPKNWTSHDEHLLTIALEHKMPWQEIADALGRTWRACFERAMLIGLANPHGHKQPQAWSDADICQLHAMWQDGESDRMIAKALGRSTKSVVGKRNVLGFNRDRDRSEASIDARSGFPQASMAERKRGEAWLTMMLGGHKGADHRPPSTYRPAHLAPTRQPHGSSISWCAQ